MPEIGTEAVEIHSVPKGTVDHVRRVEYLDGSGHVIFSGEESEWNFNEFEWVDDVRRVEELVRRTLVESLKPPDGA